MLSRIYNGTLLSATRRLSQAAIRAQIQSTRSLANGAYDPGLVRNCAIIAHVDHGKTTLMDKLLEYCGSSLTFERAMDSNEHEKERGITIMSKYTRLHYKGHTLHVVDTPGHADFGGEVERILNMVDGVVLLVDASEGPMSQTKFVLSKALAANKPAIVVLNKIDREGHRAEEVEGDIFELFCALTSKDELLDYPIMYASGRQGWVTNNAKELPGKDVTPLLDMIIKHFPAAKTPEAVNGEFALCVNTIQTDNHLGRIVTGKVESGKVSVGDRIKVLNREGKALFPDSKVTKLFYLEGLKKVDVEHAYAGEIVSLAGCDGGVTDTICAPECTQAISTIPISPPVISMTFGPNDSPLAGKEGNKLTSSMIKERLHKEIENNVTLQLRPSDVDPETLDVQGRGELQIGILVETMRREGYEMTVSPPRVLAVVGDDGVSREPFEEGNEFYLYSPLTDNKKYNYPFMMIHRPLTDHPFLRIYSLYKYTHMFSQDLITMHYDLSAPINFIKKHVIPFLFHCFYLILIPNPKLS